MARGGVIGRIGPAGTPEWEIGAGATVSTLGAIAAGSGFGAGLVVLAGFSAGLEAVVTSSTGSVESLAVFLSSQAAKFSA
jgi:hypothetical protein